MLSIRARRFAQGVVRILAPWALVGGVLLGAQPAAAQELYLAVLTPGGNEIVDASAGFGVATLAVMDDVVIYAVWLHNVQRVTAVRVHAQGAGEENATIVPLYQGRESGKVEGKFTSGWFRANAVRGMSWTDFLGAIEIGQLNVEVDLRDSPVGSLIGQLRALDSPVDSVGVPQVALQSAGLGPSQDGR